ncbi:hypothetical protein LTR62_007430 [Meristemomyces frigidus]|uniref:Uncharacterized protein n=1 Tax=Meristemomyces frigidus TaxID=1508187 RepID=A0AAN7TNJ1_9PEZI|nr:hypothetical protein LTR62_007430 [Meristemomyces frigidus]
MSPWTDTTDRQLLLTIIHLSSPLANLMGPGFTAKSTRQHFQKLRKEVKSQLGGSGASPATGTPRKCKGSGVEATPATSRRKRKGAGGGVGHDGDGDGDDDEAGAGMLGVRARG